MLLYSGGDNLHFRHHNSGPPSLPHTYSRRRWSPFTPKIFSHCSSATLPHLQLDITANVTGFDTGTATFTPPSNAVDTELEYYCTAHSTMVGNITIVAGSSLTHSSCFFNPHDTHQVQPVPLRHLCLDYVPRMRPVASVRLSQRAHGARISFRDSNSVSIVPSALALKIMLYRSSPTLIKAFHSLSLPPSLVYAPIIFFNATLRVAIQLP